jgi:hypothetical protein
MPLILGSIVILLVLIVLAAVRVSQIASWRAVAQIGISTGSLKSIIEFIRYCERL